MTQPLILGNQIDQSTLTSSGAALTPASVAATGTVTGSNLSGTNTGDQTITLTGGVTGSGTGSFAATVVTNANLTGDVTSVGNATTYAGTVPINKGGTGQTVANDALNALLPSQATNNGKYLQTNGTNTSWVAIGGSGTVTDVSVVNANGFDGTVATSTTTPAITLKTTVTGLLKGNGTAISAATVGTDYSVGTGSLATGILKSTTTSGALSIAVAGDFPTLNQNTTGTATNATNVAVTNDTTTNATMYPVWVTANTGNLPAKVSDTKITFNPSTATLTTTTFSGALSGNATTATTATTATNATNTAITDDSATNATMYPTWVTTTTGNLPQKISSTKLTFNPSTATLTTTTFSGALSGNATTATTATTATNATNVAVTDDSATNATMYPLWVTTTTGNLPAKLSSTKITFNPSTGTLTTTTFSGALSGNATTATTATNATNTAITDDTTTNATMYPTWVTTTTGNLPQKISSTKITFNPSTGLLSTTGASLSGNLTFTGTGNRITGDFSNATQSNRVSFQSSTTDGNTTINVLPNGTAVAAAVNVYSTSDPANGNVVFISQDPTTAFLGAAKNGTGTARLLRIINETLGCVTCDSVGNVIIGGTGALATSATDRFLHLNAMAGTPSGVPTVPSGYTAAGKVPVTVDTTNNLLYMYSNSSWRAVGPGAPVGAQYVTLATDSTLTNERVLAGTTNQITLTDGGAGANATLAIASNAVLPGTGSVTLPSGTTAQRTSAADALARYNTDEDITEFATGYPAGSFASWAGLQRSSVYTKRSWLRDDFQGYFPATTANGAGGEFGWVYGGAGTNANFTTPSVTDHPGIVSLRSGATSGNESRIHMGSAVNDGVWMANQVEYFCWVFRIGQVNGITLVDCKFGLGQDMSVTTQGQFGTNGVWFEFFPASSAALRFYTRSASTSSTPTSTVTVVANTWYQAEAFFDGTTWTPRVNGTNYTGINTNVPTTAVNYGAYVETLTTGNRDIDIDYTSIYTREMGNRY